VEDANDDFSVVFYTMNCDTDAIIVAMNVFSHPMMINANLFTDNCINIAIKCFPLIPLYHRCSTAF